MSMNYVQQTAPSLPSHTRYRRDNYLPRPPPQARQHHNSHRPSSTHRPQRHAHHHRPPSRSPRHEHQQPPPPPPLQPRTLAQLNPNRQRAAQSKESHALESPQPRARPTWTTALASSFLSIGLLEILIAALQSLFCALYLLTGHALLRSNSSLEGYAHPSLLSSFKIGALGGCIVTLPAIVLAACRRRGLLFLVLSFAVDTFIGAMAGALGALVLNPRHLGEMLDPLHASRAGALGGIIFSFGLLVLRLVCRW